MEEADALVIEQVRRVLTPAAMDYTIDQALRLLADQRRERVDVPERLEAEARKLRKELDRFLRVIADGTAPTSVLSEIKRREARLAEVEYEQRAFAIEEPSDVDMRRLKAALHERLARFEELLLSDIPLARQALRKLIAGRIEFRPEQKDEARGYHLRWSMVAKPLFGEGYIGMASPTGFEPVLPP
jgi:hypothetical protein